MIQAKCSICGQDLEAGDQVVTEEEVNYKLTVVDIINKGYGDKDTVAKVERAEKLAKMGARAQVQYWAHDPRNLHVDVLVTAHKECFDKIKETNNNFDKPTQNYANHKYPTLKDGVVTLKSPTDFIKKDIVK
jgi:hypothetical protein